MNAEKPKSHPLRMMAADYDPRTRGQPHEQNDHYSHNPRRNDGQNHMHRGKGKGRQRPDARSGGVEDFILPEMTTDPWIHLYHRLSPAVRERETKHLSAAERDVIEGNISGPQSAKLFQRMAVEPDDPTIGCGLPPWIGHPRALKSYAVFQPFPEHEYRKIQKLANAIHGKIYLYEHLPTKSQVVVKKMPTSNVVAFTPGLLEDALTEIGVTRFISTISEADYVVKMRGLYQDEEFTYFVTEYASGGELFEHVVQAKQLPEDLARKYTREVLLAVKSLHHNGIVHRDVSLENTLLHADGSVRVIDFGQAVHVWNPRGPRPDTPLRHTGKAGKAYYRAPEMYVGDYEGTAVDVFAVGVMLFIMTVGTPPWNSAVVTDARYKYIEKYGVTKLLTSWGKAQSMSPSLLDLIEKLMCPKPELRITVDQALTHPWILNA